MRASARGSTWFGDTGSRRSRFSKPWVSFAIGTRDHHREMVDEPIARMRMASYMTATSPRPNTSLKPDVTKLFRYHRYEIDEGSTSGKAINDY